MSFIPSAFPRAARALNAQAGHYRCLFAAPAPLQHDTRNFSQQRRAFHASPVSAATKNPYSVLGVDKSASTSEIKKAYYSAAKKYHPDSSKEPNAREKFQEVQSAYEILSDPGKKEAFDHYGEAGFDANGQPGGPGGFHPGGPFGGFGGGAGGFSGFGGGPFGAEFSFEDLFSNFAGAGKGKRRNPFTETLVGEDINVAATISFMDAAKGAKKEIRIQPQVSCRTCSGSGLKKDAKRKECGRCGGTGTRIHFMRGGFQMAATCESCGGNGLVTPPGSECNGCSGQGTVTETSSVTLDIPAGIEDGMRMRVSGEGHAPPASPQSSDKVKSRRGDLFVHITVEPHPKFSRKGADIHYTATIPMTTALLGGIVKIPTLDGDVDLRVPTGTNTGDKIVMSGMGMKKLQGGRRGGAGDLKVEFKVNMPKSLTPSQRTLLELLADEFKDKTAKRIMNVSQFAEEAKAAHGEASSSAQKHDESHHGLLKRIWDKLSGDGDKK